MERLNNKIQLGELQYFFQSSFFTGDLHIVRAWAFSKPEEIQQENNGLNVLSAFELNDIDDSISVETLTKKKPLHFSSRQFTKRIFPLGYLDPPEGFHTDPTRIFPFVVFKLKLGRVYCDQKNSAEDVSIVIPFGYDSMIFTKKRQSCLELKHSVRIKNDTQWQLFSLVELEFKPLRIDVSPPICEHCEAYDATVFCTADEVHLCDSCDYHQHSGNKLFRRHERIPVSESPHLFGTCDEHPMECVNLCCLTCYRPLCCHCLSFGSHSDPSLKDHHIVKTTDAYRLALESVEPNSISSTQSDLTKQLKSLVKQLDFIFSHIDRLSASINHMAQIAEREIEAIMNRQLQACTSAEYEWSCIIQMIEWIHDFMKHLYNALPLGRVLVAHKRHKRLIAFLFHNRIDPYNAFSTLHPMDTSSAPSPHGFNEVHLPKWVSQPVRLVGTLSITSQDPEEKYSWVQNREKMFYLSPPLNPSNPQKDEEFIPEPAWVPYTVHTSHSFRQNQAYHRIPNQDGTQCLVSHEDPWVVPGDYRGPLIYAKEKSKTASPLRNVHQEHTKRNAPDSHVMENPEHESLTNQPIASVKHPKPLHHDSSPSSVSLPPQVAKDTSTPAHFNDQNVSSPLHSNDKSLMSPKDHHVHVPEGPKLLWNPLTVPRDDLHHEIWSLLKEYRFEALIMILKACPVNKRFKLIQHFNNAANYMGDFESLAYVLFEVERYWVSRLPPTMLVNYPSLVIPFLKHVFQSDEILIGADRKFIASLTHVPFQRVKNYIEFCFEGESIRMPYGQDLKMEEVWNIDHSYVKQLLGQVTKQKDHPVQENLTLFQTLQPFLWTVVHDSLTHQLVVLTAKDLPCTFRSLLYQIGEYGSSLQTMHYPKGFLNEVSLAFPSHETPLHLLKENKNSQDWTFGAENSRRDASKVGRGSYHPRKGYPESSVCFAVEMLMTHILPSLSPFQKEPLSEGYSFLISWMLALIYKQIGKAVWRITACFFNRVDRFESHIQSNDEEMMYLTSAVLVYRWMKSLLDGPLYKPQYKTNWTQMPQKGYEAFRCITQSLTQLDHDLRVNPSLLEKTWEVCTADDLLIRTRNFERLILASATYHKRQRPLFLPKY